MLHRSLALCALVVLPAVSACSGGGASSAVVPGANGPAVANSPSVPGPGPSGAAIPPTNVADPLYSPPGDPALIAVSTNAVTTQSVAVATATPGPVLFADTFAHGAYDQFVTAYGAWAGCRRTTAQYCSQDAWNETLAGSRSWTDYTASTRVNLDAIPTVRGGVDLVFRATDAQHFYELELVREHDGSKQWELWRNVDHRWTNLARGPVDLTSGVEYGLRVQAIGSHFVLALSRDGGATYATIGSATDTTYPAGAIGLRSWGTVTASFDSVLVTSNASAAPSPANSPSPAPTGAPPAPGAYPTMTPIPPGSPPDDAYTIPAPARPIPESTPGPICIAGTQYAFWHGDDFQQESQGQFVRYTTQWEINQYFHDGKQSNWKWSDQYSGIGRRNDFGAGDTYMVHIDDANPSRSYPGSWVNSIRPRPGAQILTAADGSHYLDIRAVAVPSAYVNDSRLNGAHWLSGGIQEGPQRAFGYTEATVMMPANDGAWPSVWQIATGDGSNGWSGQLPFQYHEIDTFEKFGNAVGIDTVQMTANSGRPDAAAARPHVAGMTTAYHTYGELWVPPILGKPAYIVFYVDRKPVSYYLTEGVGNVNYMVNLQMGVPGSFVGTPDKSQVADLKLKNYFTWHPTGGGCDGYAQANPVPTPTATPSPMPPPPVAGNIVPKLMPFNPPTLGNDRAVHLPNAPANGSLLVAQGISNYAVCPTGFATIQSGVTWLCTGIVGQNGVTSKRDYPLGGSGFDRGAMFEIQNVSGFAVNPDTQANWHSEADAKVTRNQTAGAPNQLALVFGFGATDAPRYLISENYTGNVAFRTLLQTPTDATFGRGIEALVGSVDPYGAPGHTMSFTGTYAWTGPNEPKFGNNVFPQLITILVR